MTPVQFFRSLALSLGLGLAWLGVVSEAGWAAPPSPLSTFGDWMVGCDNVRSCTAIGVPPSDGSRGYGYLVIKRDGTGDATPIVSLLVGTGTIFNAAPSVTVEVDGAPVSGLSRSSWEGVLQDGGSYARGTVSGQDAVRLLRRVTTGKTLRIRATGVGRAPEDADVDTEGAAAAFAQMDKVQRRAGTVTALIDPGPAEAASIPAVPALPELTAIRMTQVAHPPAHLPHGVTPPDPDDCAGPNPPVPMVVRLSAKLSLWGVCYVRGAYSEQATFWLVGEGPARRAVFASPDAQPGAETPAILDNPILSEDGLTLNAGQRGRGAGDCGSEARWVWTGEAFHLAFLAQMDECRGVRAEDWPVSYQARFAPQGR